MMSTNRLEVKNIENNSHRTSQNKGRLAFREEIQATMERLWLQDPEQFNPNRDCIQRKRINLTSKIIKELPLPLSRRAVDLGCGGGVLTRILAESESKVDAVDIATRAIEKLKSQDMLNITPIHDCMPETKLKDNFYDLVLSTEIIGYLPASEYRMFFSELARLVKTEGFVICSSAFDINTENPLEAFANLAETEFTIENWTFSYHRVLIKLCNFFEFPQRMVKVSKNSELRSQLLSSKKGIKHFFYQFNTTKFTSQIWQMIDFVTRYIAHFLRQNIGIMNLLERLTQFFWDEAGITHAIFVGRKRPLNFPLPKKEIPLEQKHKREVWE